MKYVCTIYELCVHYSCIYCKKNDLNSEKKMQWEAIYIWHYLEKNY